MFTSDEIQASLKKFLVTEVASAKTAYGLRNTVEMKQGVFDLLATIFLLDPSSFFSLVQLATYRAAGFAAAQETDGTTLQGAISQLGKKAVPITSTAELVNAQAALLNVNAAVGRRTTGVGGKVSPTVERFQQATQAFLSGELAPNVVESGVVGTTAAAAQQTIAGLLQDFDTRHAQIEVALISLRDAVPDMAALRLPDHTTQQILAKAQSVLSKLVDTMSGDGAHAASREAMLDLLAMRAAVTKAASFAPPVALRSEEHTSELQSH